MWLPIYRPRGSCNLGSDYARVLYAPLTTFGFDGVFSSCFRPKRGVLGSLDMFDARNLGLWVHPNLGRKKEKKHWRFKFDNSS